MRCDVHEWRYYWLFPNEAIINQFLHLRVSTIFLTLGIGNEFTFIVSRALLVFAPHRITLESMGKRNDLLTHLGEHF